MKEEWHPCVHDIVDELDVSKCVWDLRKRDSRRFHSPGHKGRGHFLSEILDIRCDESNVLEEANAIAALERKVVKVYGGSSCLIFGGISLASERFVKAASLFGEIALSRHCPEYIFSALSFLSIEPIIIEDDFSDEEIRACVLNAEAVIISSPDIIFGEEKNSLLIKEAKAFGKKLCIVSDYGGGYAFSKELGGFQEKCDIALFALYKVLPCFSGSCAVVSYNDISSSFLENYDSEITAQQAMSVEYGVNIYENHFDAIKTLIENTDNLKKILLASDFAINDTIPTILSINTKEMGISGKELEARLNDMGIFVEYADIERVLFTFTVEDEKEELTHLAKDLIIAAEQCGGISEKAYCEVGKVARNKGYIESLNADSEWVDISEASGRIAAKDVWLFGIGLPVILAGDKYTKQMTEYLESPLDFRGLKKGMVKVLK